MHSKDYADTLIQMQYYFNDTSKPTITNDSFEQKYVDCDYDHQIEHATSKLVPYDKKPKQFIKERRG